MLATAPINRFIKTGSVLVLLLAVSMLLQAQAPTEDATALRDKAFQLMAQGNQAAALPLLERLAVLRPDDVAVLENLGGVLGGTARTISDLDARRETLRRARSILLRAKELGDNSDYLHIMLEQLPENGELTAFSLNQEVEKAMNEGEAAFAKADFPAALKAYQLALQLEPTNYSAALYSGDVFFNMNQMVRAGEWFAKAIQIDPNRETAYRYWADGLMKDGTDEARTKYIDAIVAEPYGKASWSGLHKWASATKATLTYPKIESKGSVSSQGEKVTINIDSNSLGQDGGANYWLIYPISRAAWRGEKFKKEFPNEKDYRHTLREEAEALAAVAGLVSKDAKDPAKKNEIAADLLALVKLHEQGLLEPYVLLSRADQGIAQDYAAYRAEHRDKLARYISEWIISMEPAK